MSVAVLSPAGAINLADLDEPTLIEHAVAGSGEAFGELYRRYRARVYGYVLSLIRTNPADAEDITAEVFVSALKSIATFRTLEATPFRAWLFGIARRRVSDWRRRARREQPKAEVELGADQGRRGKPEAIVLDQIEVQDLLTNMPARLRQVLMLRFACDLPVADVSRIMREAELKTTYVERTSEMMVGWLTKKAIAAVDDRVLAMEFRRRVRRFLADPTATWQPITPAADREVA